MAPIGGKGSLRKRLSRGWAELETVIRGGGSKGKRPGKGKKIEKLGQPSTILEPINQIAPDIEQKHSSNPPASDLPPTTCSPSDVASPLADNSVARNKPITTDKLSTEHNQPPTEGLGVLNTTGETICASDNTQIRILDSSHENTSGGEHSADKDCGIEPVNRPTGVLATVIGDQRSGIDTLNSTAQEPPANSARNPDPGGSLTTISASLSATSNSDTPHSFPSQLSTPIQLESAAANWQRIVDLTTSQLTEEERELLGVPQHGGIDSFYDTLETLTTSLRRDFQADYENTDLAKIAKIQEKLNNYSSVIGPVTKFIPYGFGIIWEVTKLMAQTAINKRKALHTVLGAIETIMDKLAICEHYAKVSDDRKLPMNLRFDGAAVSKKEIEPRQAVLFFVHLDQSLQLLYSSVVIYTLKAYYYLKKVKITDMMFSSFEDFQKPYLEKIQEAEAKIKDLANIVAMQRLQDISLMVKDIHESARAEMQAKDDTVSKQIGFLSEVRIKPFRLLHYGENPSFTGREAIGQTLIEVAARPGHQRVAICGLGGVGKTQIAIRFIYQGVDLERTNVFWVHGGNPTSFKKAYRKIAELLDSREERKKAKKFSPGAKSHQFDRDDISGMPQHEDRGVIQSDWRKSAIQNDMTDVGEIEDDEKIMKRVRDWFENNYQQTDSAGSIAWVLVVDNADNPLDYEHGSRPSEIARYLPQSGAGMLLITTRSSSVASQMRCNPIIPVDEMGLPEATVLFENIYFSDANSETEIARLGRTELLPQLLNELDFLPLAIVAAASFMRRTHSNIEDYRSMMQSIDKTPLLLKFSDIHRETQHEDGLIEKEISESVITTFHITFSRMASLEYGACAMDILGVLALINRRAVPLELLEEAVKSSAGLVEFRVGLGHLIDFSLITMNADRCKYDMHRLVHHSAKLFVQQTSEVQRKSWQRAALQAIAALFPGLYERVVNRSRDEIAHSVYGNHAIELINSVLPLQETWERKDRVGLANLLQEVGCLGLVNSTPSESDRYLYIAAQIFTSYGSVVDLARVNLRRGFLCTTRKEAEPALALAFTTSALQVMLSQFGPQNLETIHCFLAVGHAHYMNCNYSSAFQALSSALKEATATLEKTDPLFLLILGGMGTVLADQGKAYARAIKCFEHLHDLQMEARSRAHDSYSPALHLKHISRLYALYCSRSDYDAALKVENCRLRVAKESFGVDSADALQAMTEIASLKHKMGEYSEGVELCQLVIATARKMQWHMVAFDAESELGSCYVGLGRIDMACEVFESILSAKDQLYGKEDTRADTFCRHVGEIFLRHKVFDQGLDWLQRAYQRRKLVYERVRLNRPTDPYDSTGEAKPLSTKTTLAWNCDAVMKEKCEEEGRRQLQRSIEEDLMIDLGAIAGALKHLLRYKDALTSYQEILEYATRMHPPVRGKPANHSVWFTMKQIASCYERVETGPQLQLALQWLINAYNALTGLEKTIEYFEEDETPNAKEFSADDWETRIRSSLGWREADGLDVDLAGHWAILSLEEKSDSDGAGVKASEEKSFLTSLRDSGFSALAGRLKKMWCLKWIAGVFISLGRKWSALWCSIKGLKAVGLRIDTEVGYVANFNEVLDWLKDLRRRREREVANGEDSEHDLGDPDFNLPSCFFDEPIDEIEFNFAEGIIEELDFVGCNYLQCIDTVNAGFYYKTLALAASTILHGPFHEFSLTLREDVVWLLGRCSEGRKEAYILTLSLLRKLKAQELHGDLDDRIVRHQTRALQILQSDELTNDQGKEHEDIFKANLQWHVEYMEKRFEASTSMEGADEEGYKALEGILIIGELYHKRKDYDDSWNQIESVRRNIDKLRVPRDIYEVISALLRSRQLAIKEELKTQPTGMLSTSFRKFCSDLFNLPEFAYITTHTKLAWSYAQHFRRPDLAYSCLSKSVPVILKLVEEFGAEFVGLFKWQDLHGNHHYCDSPAILSWIFLALDIMADISYTQKGHTGDGSLDYSTSIALCEAALTIRLEMAKAKMMEGGDLEGDNVELEEDFDVSSLRLQIASLTDFSGDFASAEVLYKRVVAARTASYLRIATKDQLNDYDSETVPKLAVDSYEFLLSSILLLASFYIKTHRFDLADKLLHDEAKQLIHTMGASDRDYASHRLRMEIIESFIGNWERAAALTTLDQAFAALEGLSVQEADNGESKQNRIHGQRLGLLESKALLFSNYGDHTEAVLLSLEAIHHHQLTHEAVKNENCPTCIGNRIDLALSKGHTGDLEEAKESCLQAMDDFKRLHPNGLKNERGHRVMGQLYMMEERWDQASEELRVVLWCNRRKNAASRMERARTEGLLAVCERQLGNVEEAKALLCSAKSTMEEVCERDLLERCVWYREIVEEMEILEEMEKL